MKKDYREEFFDFIKKGSSPFHVIKECEKKLEKAGYMTTYSQAYQGRKRKYYSITQEGKNHLQFLNEEWLTYKETLDGIVEGRLRHDKD